MAYTCTPSSGSAGYNGSGSGLAASGSISSTAAAAWAGTSSTCVWTATGAGGATATYRETVTTNPAPGVEVVTYIHTDALGSPVAKSDANGNVIAGSRTRYEPYGATASGAIPTIGFTGHVNDANTGLVYMQQRYYDPIAGRFLSTDPVLTDANTGSSFNRYVYANNSPYRYIDPDGRDPEHAYVPGGLTSAEYKRVNAEAGGVVARVVLTIGKFIPQTAIASQLLSAALTDAEVSLAGTGASAGDAAGASVVPTRGASGGPRAGKNHTPAAKKASLAANKAKNDGKAICPKCNKEMADPKQSKSGESKDMTQAEGDHTIPKSQGGDGATVKDMRNIETICAQCNNTKSDH
jgi:RHS repeat-associated protein